MTNHHTHPFEELDIPPSSRMRRTRMTERHRRLVRETSLEPSNLILPLFAVEADEHFKKAIDAMPGVQQLGLNGILKQCEAALEADLGGVILFGIPKHKDEFASQAYNEEGIIQTTLRETKRRFPELLVATDVCLCEYTEHGHCGVIERDNNGDIEIVNDKSVELLVREAISHAEAGSD